MGCVVEPSASARFVAKRLQKRGCKCAPQQGGVGSARVSFAVFAAAAVAAAQFRSYLTYDSHAASSLWLSVCSGPPTKNLDEALWPSRHVRR